MSPKLQTSWEMPIQHSHRDQQHDLPNPVAFQGKDNGGPREQTGATPGDYLGQVAWGGSVT
jgi:hypothetical protein